MEDGSVDAPEIKSFFNSLKLKNNARHHTGKSTAKQNTALYELTRLDMIIESQKNHYFVLSGLKNLFKF